MDTPSLFSPITSAYRKLSVQKVFVVWVTIALSFLFLILGLITINNTLVITIPKRGGELVEGIVGTPRFINPVLASNSQDEVLTNLIFAGLTRIDKNNNAILDMASSIEKSSDGLSYKVTLRDNAAFHDGQKVTADDVVFTLSLIQNPLLKSPQKIKWEGVKIEKLTDSKILFTLKQPYPLFTRSLSIGILPKHIWKNLSIEEVSLSDLNIHAIGSGPYKVTNIEQVSGIPRVFTLHEYKEYSLGRPYISTLVLRSYQNEKLLEQAFAKKEVDSFSTISHIIDKGVVTSDTEVSTMVLPQTFSIFFNPNKATFLADKDIRKALDLSLHKESLVKSLYGNGAEAAHTHFPFEVSNEATPDTDPKTLIAGSAFIKKNATSSLAITLTIGDSEDNRKLAEAVKEKWDALGVKTTIEIFEFSDLNLRVIKPREFQAVLSGTLVEDVSGLYAFWHSSQRAYPGLNIANYASTKMDQNLENLRIESDDVKRESFAQAIEAELRDETPAIFLYHPKLLYIVRKPLFMSFPPHGISESARFSNIELWYKETEKVWRFSYQQKAMKILEALLH